MSEGFGACIFIGFLTLLLACGIIWASILYWKNPCNRMGHDYEKVGERHREEVFIPNKDKIGVKGYALAKVYDVLWCKRCKHFKVVSKTSSKVDF